MKGAAKEKKETTEPREQVRNEYLEHILVPRQHFSVPAQNVEISPEGEQRQVDYVQHFEIVRTMTSHKRPHLVSAFDENDQAYLKAPLSFFVQMYSRLELDTDEDGEQNAHTVFQSADPAWMLPRELAEFQVLAQSLVKWSQRPSAVDACIEVFNPVEAKVTLPRTDLRCPTLAVYAELLRLNWTPVQHRVEHVNNMITQVDARDGMRMKLYYQVLLRLGLCLQLCRPIPSDEPILFYELLLRGQKVLPYKGNSHYKLQIAKLGTKTHGAAILAIGNGDEELPIVPKVPKGLRIGGGALPLPGVPRAKAPAKIHGAAHVRAPVRAKGVISPLPLPPSEGPGVPPRPPPLPPPPLAPPLPPEPTCPSPSQQRPILKRGGSMVNPWKPAGPSAGSGGSSGSGGGYVIKALGPVPPMPIPKPIPPMPVGDAPPPRLRPSSWVAGSGGGERQIGRTSILSKWV